MLNSFIIYFFGNLIEYYSFGYSAYVTKELLLDFVANVHRKDRPYNWMFVIFCPVLAYMNIMRFFIFSNYNTLFISIVVFFMFYIEILLQYKINIVGLLGFIYFIFYFKNIKIVFYLLLNWSASFQKTSYFIFLHIIESKEIGLGIIDLVGNKYWTKEEIPHFFRSFIEVESFLLV